MVEQEFLGVQDGPEDVFVALAFGLGGFEGFAVGTVAGLGEVGFGKGEFGGLGHSRVGGEIELAEFFVVAARVGGELGGGAGFGGDLVLDVFGVQEVEGLGEAGFLGAFAFAGALVPAGRPAKALGVRVTSLMESKRTSAVRRFA